MVELSVVIPVYNSEGCLEALHRQLGEPLRGMAHEVIYVDDQSTDASWPTLCRLCAGDPSRVGLRLRKNVGQDNAILCGLRRVRGASVVVMDDDLQHAPSDIPALYARCREQDLDVCYARRKKQWRTYYAALKPLANQGFFEIPVLPPNSTNNAHMFYLVCRSQAERARLIAFLKARDIQAATHYLSLRASAYYRDKHTGPDPVYCLRFVNRLVRLPLFDALKREEAECVADAVKAFYRSLLSVGADPSNQRATQG